MKLNTFSSHLVPLLNLPMSEFTELQRALKDQVAHFDPESDVNAFARQSADTSGVGFDPDLLKGKPGPGGGVDVDDFRAAFFLLAVILGGPRKESARVAWTTWHLNQKGSILCGYGNDWTPTFNVCPLTGRHLFGDALKAVVSDPHLARRIDEIAVSSNLWAEIRYDGGEVSAFEKPYKAEAPALYRVAVLSGRALQAVAAIIKRGGV